MAKRLYYGWIVAFSCFVAITIAGEPTRVEYPSPDGKGVIPVMVTYLWDRDGYYVELNTILGTPAGVKPGGQ
jgi:hypothetical protein